MDVSALDAMQRSFDEGTTRSYEWRVAQLCALKRMLTERKTELCAALNADLRKSPLEGEMCEIATSMTEASELHRGLRQWMEPEPVSSPGAAMPCFSYVRREPRGPVLVIGPFNYPLACVLGPMAGALSGGNPVVIKPSELTPAVSSKLAELVPLYFKPTDVYVVEGAVETTTALMERTWGLVFFTGSERVGKIIAGAAAKTLTPTVLELGGKSPVVVDVDIPELKTMANRLAWGKLVNAGQTCVAPDYMLCHEARLKEVTASLVSSIKDMYGEDPSTSDLPRIVTQGHAQRLYDLIREAEQAGAKVLCGGSAKCDVPSKYIAPTLLVDTPLSCRVMNEEIFGPILCVRAVRNVDEAIEFIKARPGTPLALYVFTASQTVCDRVLDACPSGGCMRNDCVLHYACKTPFGGLGTSGYGNMREGYSFKTFTHERAFVYKPCKEVFDFGGIRYSPYNKFSGQSGNILIMLMRVLPSIPNLRSKLSVRIFVLAAAMLLAGKKGPRPVRNALAGVTDKLAMSLRGFADSLRV